MSVDNLLSPNSHPTAGMEDANTDNPHKRMKRTASSPDLATELSSTASPSGGRQHESPIRSVAGNTLTLDSDPYQVDPKLTEYYLNEYFDNVNIITYCMFPRVPFMKWVKNCGSKSVWDKMLIYGMLAHGSVFASNSQKKAHGVVFSDIAHQAVSQCAGVFNLQVVQTRMVLSLYNFALGNSATAWDFAGAAIRAACGMRLNFEDGVNDVKDEQAMDYGFSRAVLVECRRRTFWSAYIMDHFKGFCTNHLPMFHDTDCLLRLPCDERQYEEELIPVTPFFGNGTIISQQSDQSGVGMMGHLVQLASICGGVLARVFRSRYQSPGDCGEPFEAFYKRTMEQLRAWENRLGPRHRSTPENMARAEQDGYLGAYGALHTLYHCTMMKLNRYVRYTQMTSEQVTRNIRTAWGHAGLTLELMQDLAKLRRAKKTPPLGFIGSSPFTGFAILSAIDILTSTGTLTDLFDTQSRTMSLTAGSIQFLEELSAHWCSAKRQTRLVAERYGDLMVTAKSILFARKVAFFASSPMETTIGLEDDLIYATPRRQVLDILGMGASIVDNDDLLEIRRQCPPGVANLEGNSSWTNDRDE